MGVTVQIGSDERVFSDVTESWIHDQIERRRRDRVSVCIIVKIQESGLNLQSKVWLRMELTERQPLGFRELALGRQAVRV